VRTGPEHLTQGNRGPRTAAGRAGGARRALAARGVLDDVAGLVFVPLADDEAVEAELELEVEVELAAGVELVVELALAAALVVLALLPH
jgi:hypothetical protein